MKPANLLLAPMILWLLLAGCTPVVTPLPTQELPVSTLLTPELEVETPTVYEPQPWQTLTPSQTPSLCHNSPGEMREDVLQSVIEGKTIDFKVYLPPCYQQDSNRRYPALYLLHGLGADSSLWIELGLPSKMDALIASDELPPFIIIMPSEPNAYPPDKAKYDSVIVKELLPYIDAHYATQATRQARAIGGISRGSAWALRIGVAYPELFSAIGMHSVALFNGDYTFSSIRRISALSVEQMPRLFMDIGAADPELITAIAIESAINDALIPHTWYQFSGAHDAIYWEAHLKIYLLWYGSGW